MTISEKAEAMLNETLDMLRSKPAESTLTEHFFLADEAWEKFKETGQIKYYLMYKRAD